MAVGIGSYLRHDIAGQNGVLGSGAVYDLPSGAPVPKLTGAVPGATEGWFRFFTANGKFLFARKHSTSGMSGSTPVFDYQLVYNLASLNEKKYVQLTGTPTGGSFAIGINGIYTADIAYSGITSARIQAALDAHPDLGPGNSIGTWDAGAKRAYIEFTGIFAHCGMTPYLFGASHQLIGGAVTAGTSIGGLSDVAASQQHIEWDLVGFDGTSWSGGQPTLRSAIGPQRIKLLVDYPVGLASWDIQRPVLAEGAKTLASKVINTANITAYTEIDSTNMRVVLTGLTGGGQYRVRGTLRARATPAAGKTMRLLLQSIGEATNSPTQLTGTADTTATGIARTLESTIAADITLGAGITTLTFRGLASTSDANNGTLTNIEMEIELSDPTVSDDVVTPVPEFTWRYETGTIGGFPLTRIKHTFFDLTAGAPYPIHHQHEDSGASLSGLMEYQIPMSAKFGDGRTYLWRIEFWKSSGAYSARDIQFTINYPRPAAPDSAVIQLLSHVGWINAQWDETTAVNPFVAYVWKVRPADELETSTKNVEIFRTSSETLTQARLYRVPCNRPVILSFYEEQLQYGVPVLTLAQEFPIVQTIHSVIIVNPVTFEIAHLDFYDDERSIGYEDEPRRLQLWGLNAPIPVFGGPRPRVMQLTTVIHENGNRIDQQKEYQIIESLYLNKQGRTLIYRDGDGEVIDVILGAPTKRRLAGGQPLRVDVTAYEVEPEATP